MHIPNQSRWRPISMLFIISCEFSPISQTHFTLITIIPEKLGQYALPSIQCCTLQPVPGHRPIKFLLSYCYNPLQDTCPITSAVLGHLIRTHVPLVFLDRDKKSHRLSEKCATLSIYRESYMLIHTVVSLPWKALPPDSSINPACHQLLKGLVNNFQSPRYCIKEQNKYDIGNNC